MKKTRPDTVAKEIDFYHWLLPQPDKKLSSDFYTVLPIINSYGKRHNSFEESLFEMGDSEHATKFFHMVENDKRFRFLNYGHIKQILSVLQKYCEYIEGREKAAVPQTSVPVGENIEDPHYKDPFIGRPQFEVPQSTVSAVEDMKSVKSGQEEVTFKEPASVPTTKKNGFVVIRTVNGTEYAGDTPAEALASYCEAIAQKYPDKVKELIGQKILTTEGSCQDRISLNNVSAYIDRVLKESAAMRYAKWLADSCGDTDTPKTILVSANKPEEGQTSIKSEPVVPDDSSRQDKSPEELTKPDLDAASSHPRAWSKYEVALLIEAYLKTAEKDANFRTTAEDLSHTLRELAAKNGKAIDSTYRNVNGMIMQLGTVQYVFTDGKKGLSNASAQIRDMVCVYKNWPSDFQQILSEAHRLIDEPANEIYVLFPEEDFALLRNELFRQKILTLEQLKVIDLWSFVNRYGLYSISSRHDICNRVKARLNPTKTDDKDKKYYLKTKSGKCYYGNSAAEALVAFCDALVLKYPLKIRSLIGQRYNGIGLVVLQPQNPQMGGVKLSGITAYVDNFLADNRAVLYGTWICQKCGETDEPVSLLRNVQPEQKIVPAKEKNEPVNKSAVQQPVVEKKKFVEADTRKVVFQPVSQDELQRDYARKEEKVETQVKRDDKTGEGWLFKMLSVMNIRYEDKRDKKGCLWIWGGHDLDQFIDLCAQKGYRFYHQPNAPKGPAWWTTDCVTTELPAEKLQSEKKQELPVEKRVRLADYELWLIRQKALTSTKAKSYFMAMQSLEGYVERNKMGESLLLGSASRCEMLRGILSSRNDYHELDQKMNFSYSQALDLWIEFLNGTSRKPVAGQQEEDSSEKQESKSKSSFRQWLESEFRSYLVRNKSLSSSNADQYCQSIEDIEQFIQRNNLPMSLVEASYEDASKYNRQLHANPVYVGWNRRSNYKYSAAFGEYINFLKSKLPVAEKPQKTDTTRTTGFWRMPDIEEPVKVREPEKKPSAEISTPKPATIKEAIILIMAETDRPMSVSEICQEIENRKLYTFNSNNPRMIVEKTIRKSCVGIYIPNHTKENSFGCLTNKGRVQYYLLAEAKPEAKKKEQKQTVKEVNYPVKNNQSKIVAEDVPVRARTKIDARWKELLNKNFPDGYILNDFLSQLQASTFWMEAFGEECPVNGAAIDEAMKASGTVRDGRVFVSSEEESNLIDEICSEIIELLKEYTAVYTKCVYDRYQDKLAKHSIFTEKVMVSQLQKTARNRFYLSGKTFVRQGHEQQLTADCRKVLRNQGGAMSVADVQKVLWFIPGDSVYHTLSVDKSAINISTGVWMLAEHFPLTSDEADSIGDALEEYFISNDYIQAVDILPLLNSKLPSIADNLGSLHFSAVFNILKYYLDDRFEFTKAIISPKGVKTDFITLFHNYAVEHDHFTVDEVSAFAKEMRTPVYWETLYDAGAVRISADELINKRDIHFDIDATDKVLEDVCIGDYLPLQSVSPAIMMHLPACGYQWNGFLLLNYVYSFSKIFKASYNSLSKTGAYGAMVRRDCTSIRNYEQLIERVLTDDDTWSTVDDVRTLLVQRGFQASRWLGGIDKIIVRAKQNKLKDRG